MTFSCLYIFAFRKLVEGAQISAWKRTELVDRVKDLKKQIIDYEKKVQQERILKLKADAVQRIEAGQVQNPEVLLLDAGSNNKVLNEILKIYGKQSKDTHVLLFSVDVAASKVLCLAQTPKVILTGKVEIISVSEFSKIRDRGPEFSNSVRIWVFEGFVDRCGFLDELCWLQELIVTLSLLGLCVKSKRMGKLLQWCNWWKGRWTRRTSSSIGQKRHKGSRSN